MTRHPMPDPESKDAVDIVMRPGFSRADSIKALDANKVRRKWGMLLRGVTICVALCVFLFGKALNYGDILQHIGCENTSLCCHAQGNVQGAILQLYDEHTKRKAEEAAREKKLSDEAEAKHLAELTKSLSGKKVKSDGKPKTAEEHQDDYLKDYLHVCLERARFHAQSGAQPSDADRAYIADVIKTLYEDAEKGNVSLRVCVALLSFVCLFMCVFVLLIFSISAPMSGWCYPQTVR